MVILCGGRGDAAAGAHPVDSQAARPGRRPTDPLARDLAPRRQGFSDFLLLTGYRGDRIASFVASSAWPADVRIRCVDTGEDTPTGGRLHRAAALLGRERFCLAYADAVADIDLGALIDHHDRAGAAATMAVVRPRLPFGVARLGGDGDMSRLRREARSEQWVNAGFFCLEPAVLALLCGPESVLEREPLSALAGDGRLLGLPPRRLLALHGHLQGRGRAQRAVGRGPGRRPVAGAAPVG